jgi:DNA-binding transcriptional MerR regulator
VPVDGESARPAGGAPDADRGVYGISVAAELVGMSVQSLRFYEARDLLDPDRTAGGTRRYSANDLTRLRRIGQLLGAGLNLAGIAMVLDLEDENAQLRAEQEGNAMTDHPFEAEAAEHDLAEQQVPVIDENDDEVSQVLPETTLADVEANEADVLEQHQPVSGDDLEDYPPGDTDEE